MAEDIFHKILNNTATGAEKKDFFSSLENDSEKRDEFYRYKNLYVLSNLNLNHYSEQQHVSFSKFWNRVQSQKHQRVISLWIRYVAIFAIASILGFMANYILNRDEGSVGLSQHIEYSSEKGSVSKIHLEDGSTIWLSSGTHLILNKNQQGETMARLNGEAFFDLIPNPSRKFIVDLGHFMVKDIGTQFNIRAYESEQSITAALVNGQIDVINSEKYLLAVKPGEFVRYDKSNQKISVNQQDPSIVTAWKDGKFVFIDKPLSEICKELENWYNVKIQIEDQKLAKTRYTSVIKRSTTVKMVLQILAITDHIYYKITDKEEGKDIVIIGK